MSLDARFRRHRSTVALCHRDFRLLLLGSGIVSFVMPVQFLTQIFWVEDHYADHEVLYVGLLGVSRGAAMLLFSLFGGAVADRFERRRVLLFCESTALTLNTLVAVLMLTQPFGEATMAALLVLTFAASGNMAVDMPARTASIPAIVGMEHLANGISLQMIAQQLTTPLALPLVGLLNSAFDSGVVYAGTLFAWLAILPLISMLRYRSLGEANRRASVLGNIREGLAYTRADATIFAVIAAVLIVQVVGMPGPAILGPVWMTNVLGLSKAQFGFIAMTWGAGAMVGSVFFARQHELTGRGPTLCAMLLLFAASAVVFGFSRIVAVTAVANFGLGFALVGTTVCASTIVQHTVRDEMRGRVMGLFPLAMGLGMLAAGPASGAGQVYGLEVVVPSLAVATLVLGVALVSARPVLRTYRPPALADAPAPVSA